jgi:hypothetical protein
MCDGFETGTFAEPPWSTNFCVTIDAEHVYRGKLAAHAHTPALTGGGAMSYLIDNTNRTTLAAGTTYMRAFLYLTGTSSQTIQISAVDPVTNPPGQVVSVNTTNGQLYVWGDQTTTTLTGVALPTDRWTCLEWSVRGSTTTSSGDAEMVVWLDSTQIADVTSFNLSPSQEFTLGIYDQGVQPATDLWMDEVALDTARIGCQR